MIYNISEDLNTTTQLSIFKDGIADHFHEIENDFIYIPQCYRENKKSTNIGHLEHDVYYEHDCISSMDAPSQKSPVDSNTAAQEGRTDMD